MINKRKKYQKNSWDIPKLIRKLEIISTPIVVKCQKSQHEEPSFNILPNEAAFIKTKVFETRKIDPEIESMTSEQLIEASIVKAKKLGWTKVISRIKRAKEEHNEEELRWFLTNEISSEATLYLNLVDGE